MDDMKSWNIIEVTNAKDGTIDTCTFTDSFVMFTHNKAMMVNHKFKNNKIRMTDAINTKLYTNYNFIVRTDRLGNCNGVFEISNNTVVSERTTGSSQYFVYVLATDNVGSTVDMLINDNILKAATSGKLTVSIHKDSVCKITTRNNLRDTATVSLYPSNNHINAEDDYVRSQRRKVILTSPNGTHYQLNVGDTGTIGITGVS